MKENKLIIKINRSASDIFTFVTTPPNSKLWIDSIIDEETNEWPVRVGTIYNLKGKDGQYSQAIVASIEKDKFIEWVSEENNYHCKYTFRPINNITTEFEYYEWVDKGKINNPFTQDTLEKLKSVLENPKNITLV